MAGLACHLAMISEVNNLLRSDKFLLCDILGTTTVSEHTFADCEYLNTSQH